MLSNTSKPDTSLAKPLLPTKSPAVDPTRLLALLTAPVSGAALLIQVTAPLLPFQLVVVAAHKAPFRFCRLPLPTRSLTCVPTRLLPDETAPLNPTARSTQVMAPADAILPPLFQSGLSMARLLPKLEEPPLPTRSPAVLPTRLLPTPTMPVLPDTLLNSDTAPRVPFHSGLNTSDPAGPKLLVPPEPIRSPAAAPTRLLPLVIAPTNGAALSIQVMAPVLPLQFGVRTR